MKIILWLVIANTSEAKIYQIENRSKYKLIKQLSHEESRLKSGELITDKPGHYQSGMSGHGQFMPPSDAHQTEHKHFAKEIAKFLDHERKNQHYQALILCVEPHFQGQLNNELAGSVQTLVKKRIQKNYIPFPENKLNAKIATIIHEPL